MRNKGAWAWAAAILLVVAASAVTFAELGGGGEGGDQNLEIERDPPGESECICPAIWDPVVCRAADGTWRAFSNACVAACNGFTKCRSFAVVGP